MGEERQEDGVWRQGDAAAMGGTATKTAAASVPSGVAPAGASYAVQGGAASPAAPRRRRRRSRRAAPAFAPYEWWISWRYLRAKRKENFASIISMLSFIGIMLGVATLITVMAVMNGFRSDLMNRILGLDAHAYVIAHGRGEPLLDFDRVAADIRKVPGVASAVPIVEGGVLAGRGGAFSFTFVRGIRPEDLEQLSGGLQEKNVVKGGLIVAGRLDDLQGGRSIAIGSGMARDLGIFVGDRITLLSPHGASTAFGTAPRQKSYEVVAIFEVGYPEFDAALAFLPLEQAQIYFGTGSGVSKIDVMVDDPLKIDSYHENILKASGAGVFVADWRARRGSLFGALQVERNVMFIILGLIIIVAALNIISGLVMLVKDKGRDIAVLRTMGASSGTVLRIFLIAGAAIGVVGTLAGFGLGVLLSLNIESIRQFLSAVLQAELFPSDVYLLDQMRAEINNLEVVAVLAFALTLSILAPLYPAWRAARLDPVEALRYE